MIANNVLIITMKQSIYAIDREILLPVLSLLACLQLKKHNYLWHMKKTNYIDLNMIPDDVLIIVPEAINNYSFIHPFSRLLGSRGYTRSSSCLENVLNPKNSLLSMK